MELLLLILLAIWIFQPFLRQFTPEKARDKNWPRCNTCGRYMAYKGNPDKHPDTVNNYNFNKKKRLFGYNCSCRWDMP